MVKGHNLAHCGGDLVVQESFFDRLGVKAGQLWGVIGEGLREGLGEGGGSCNLSTMLVNHW